MDVGTTSRIQTSVAAMQSAYQSGAAKKTGKEENAENAAEAKEGAAYAVDISAEGQAASEATKTKGLSADDITALQQDIEQKSIQMMIDILSANNEKLQGFLDDGIGMIRLGGVEIDASKFALPEVATNAEDAAKALEEGGDWSVSAVADRIFGLASAIAGDDPDKLEQMRSAVEEGFKQAGLSFKEIFGEKEDMPQITKDTHAEIMSRFDKRYGEITGAATATTTEE